MIKDIYMQTLMNSLADWRHAKTWIYSSILLGAFAFYIWSWCVSKSQTQVIPDAGSCQHLWSPFCNLSLLFRLAIIPIHGYCIYLCHICLLLMLYGLWIMMMAKYNLSSINHGKFTIVTCAQLNYEVSKYVLFVYDSLLLNSGLLHYLSTQLHASNQEDDINLQVYKH